MLLHYNIGCQKNKWHETTSIISDNLAAEINKCVEQIDTAEAGIFRASQIPPDEKL